MTIREGLEHAGPVSPILFAPSDRAAARVREASRRLSLVMMAPWDTMGAYGDQITTSQCTLYFVCDEAGCIVSYTLGLEKTKPVSVEMNGIVMVNHMIETFCIRQIS